jgi:cystathionine beta-lyase
MTPRLTSRIRTTDPGVLVANLQFERSSRQGTDKATLIRHFGTDEDVLPMWIAEPNVALAPTISEALQRRAELDWYGYETRPDQVLDSFWSWMQAQHTWEATGLHTLISPSVGTSIGVMIEQMTGEGDGVILQPPVFTNFKPLVVSSGRTVVQNPLVLSEGRYEMDFDDLEAKAADPRTRMLILCSPHNPVGRVWTTEELSTVASICGTNNVFVMADELHADLAQSGHTFMPFARAAEGIDVVWAAAHGPIKTFGLAGVCDTVLITPSADIAAGFEKISSRLHLTRNNVFALAAFDTAYRTGVGWLDQFRTQLDRNLVLLRSGLPDSIKLIRPEGTYLAWLDLRELNLEVSEMATWLGSAGVGLSPGHWFGRQGAGFARMTFAVPESMISEAAARLSQAASLI